MGVSNNLNCWRESSRIGKKCFGYNDEVVQRSEEKPTARVLMDRCGVNVSLECVLGIGVGSDERLGVCEGPFKFVSNHVCLKICSSSEERDKNGGVVCVGSGSELCDSRERVWF